MYIIDKRTQSMVANFGIDGDYIKAEKLVNALNRDNSNGPYMIVDFDELEEAIIFAEAGEDDEKLAQLIKANYDIEPIIYDVVDNHPIIDEEYIQEIDIFVEKLIKTYIQPRAEVAHVSADEFINKILTRQTSATSRQIKAFDLRFVGGYKLSEIAEEMRVSTEDARRLVHNALVKGSRSYK